MTITSEIKSVFMVCIDDSAHAQQALRWSMNNVVTKRDKVILVNVMPPLPVAAGVAGEVAVIQLMEQADKQRLANKQRAEQLIKEASDLVSKEYKIPSCQIISEILPACGGSSGVADSIVEFANKVKPTMVFLGSRGLGAIKRHLMSFIGLGSVVDYCSHHLKCPIMVVKALADDEAVQESAEESHGATKKICIAVDGSEHSQEAVQWALQHVFHTNDELHLVSIANPVYQPVLVDEALPVAMIPLDGFDIHSARDHAQREAFKVASEAASLARMHQVPEPQIRTAALAPEGGASDVGKALERYVHEQHVDIMVVGARQMGDIKRSIVKLIGSGSVSDHCVHHLQIPVLVHKHIEDGH